MKQNYPDKIIDDAIEKCKKLDRKDLPNPIQRNKTQSIIPLVRIYNLRNPNVTPTFKHLNEVLKTDETFSKIFEKRKFINSKRQPKNLRRILTKSISQKKQITK